MKNEASNKTLTNSSSDNKRSSLRQKSRKDYSGQSESFLNNLSQGLNNGRWTLEEHRKFITGVFLYGNNWKEIINIIGTRNAAQARSHCQKYFTKLAKLNLEGITEEMCNVKKLNYLYKSLSKDDLKSLYYILTDVAYHNMESDNESLNTVRINLQDIERVDMGLGSSSNLFNISVDGCSDKNAMYNTNIERNANIAQFNRKMSFDSELDTIKQENDISGLIDQSMDIIPEPKLVKQIVDEQGKVECYYSWLFDNVMNSIPDDLLNLNNLNNQNTDVDMSDEINGYSNGLTFNYFNSFN
jgi:SHAQKYF class myb-like DNA-binding protein